MSTWWSLVPRADLGLRSEDMMGRPFTVTNRGWYFIYRLLQSMNARSVHLLAEPEPYIPSRLAVHWGQLIGSAAGDEWLLIGRFNGQKVVAAGITHKSAAASLQDECELTPLAGTPAFMWLLAVGQELASTVTGYLISGKPRKGSSMSMSLVKGQKVDITKAAEDTGGRLSKIKLGLGWDVRSGLGDDFDLDASVVICDSTGNAVPDGFVYFNHLSGVNGAVNHSGDNLTGEGAGDDETITIDLDALPSEATDIRAYVSIFEAAKRGKQTFATVNNAFCRLIDESTGTELCRFDLTEDTAPGTNVVEFAKISKGPDGNWTFKVMVTEYGDEIDGIVQRHKVQ